MILRLRLGLSLIGVVLPSLTACGGERVTPVDPAADPTPLYWRLTLNQRAINLSTVAPYDTFRLVATPRALNDTSLDGPSQVTFTSGNANAVQVSPDGLVRGVLAAERIPVVVRVTQGTVTHVDTARVSVTTAPPPVVDRLVLEPGLRDPFTGESRSIDSAKGALSTDLGAFYYSESGLVPRTLDGEGNEIPNLAIRIESSDPLIAFYQNETGTLTSARLGTVTFVASTVAYGTALIDSLVYTVQLPLFAGAGVQARFGLGNPTPSYRIVPDTVRVGTGAYFWWFRDPGVPAYDVTFDDPTQVAADTATIFGLPVLALLDGDPSLCGTGGNIVPFDTNASGLGLCSRYFPAPRTYHYQSAALQASGTIVVVDESQPAATTEAAAWSTATLGPTVRSASPRRPWDLPLQLQRRRQNRVPLTQLLP